ncbi:Lipid phosphate phosphohydrolase 1-like [Oopsacas minuta]|uniref:Lipid phosphate phosphohydrolase 1-like n=1 Tax=Oopsacas minuta TaxID=111878 RepID=A0AAV7K3Y9_9METZ|nr:Lipid phosphate phosphohydrolase 1-like [Oopsacas minuta]
MSERNALLHPEIHYLGNNDITSNRVTIHYSIIHLIFELLFPITLAIVLTLISLIKFPLTQLGFFCDDRTIRYPYQESTVKSYEMYLFLVPTILSFIILTLVEQFSQFYERKCLQTLAKTRPVHVILNCIVRNFEVPFWLWKFVYILYAFVVGHLVTMVVTYSLKLSVGELRPHFLDVCKPNLSLTTCKNTLGFEVYVTNYTCTGDSDLVREGRLSFPSGHSSFISYNMAFLIFYLETKQFLPRGFRSFLSIVFAIVACLISLSRLDDFKHHNHDVIAGMAIGVVTAAFMYFYIMRYNIVISIHKKRKKLSHRVDHDLSGARI